MMRTETNLRRNLLVVFALVVSACLFSNANAQTTDPPNNPAAAQAQGGPAPDLAQLNLTPDQIQKIRLINAELKDQRQAANQRLRLAQRGLAEAMESPNPNETLIDQRSREVADAQAATFRLRTLSEFRIIQVLTPDQRMKLREMRARNQAMRRERIENNQRPRILRRGDALQGNKLGPRPAGNTNRARPLQTPQRPKP